MSNLFFASIGFRLTSLFFWGGSPLLLCADIVEKVAVEVVISRVGNAIETVYGGLMTSAPVATARFSPFSSGFGPQPPVGTRLLLLWARAVAVDRALGCV